MNPTTFVEGTYGFIRNELAGGNENGVLHRTTSANRLNAAGGLANFPLLYPDAGVVDPRYYALPGHGGPQPGVLGRHVDQPAAGFAWGSRIGARAAQPALSRLAEHQPDAGRAPSA